MLQIELSLSKHSYFAAIGGQQLNLSTFVYIGTYAGGEFS